MTRSEFEQDAADERTVLVVDDAPENLHLLARILTAQGYRPRAAPSGRLALVAAENDPPDLILLDVLMPGMDGFEVCRRLKQIDKLKGIPVIFLSGLEEPEDKAQAFAVGGVDYITKPFNAEEVMARVSAHMALREMHAKLERHNRDLQTLVEQQVADISASQMATIFALAKLAEARDDDTGRHLERVQDWCRLLAERLREQRSQEEMSETFVENIVHTSPLHDIGKVGIRDAVLLKPGKLSPDEFEEMKKHSVIGADTLVAVAARYPTNAFIHMGVEIARWHHEKWNGSGYPDGLKGSNIPLSARIMAVADVYDALRSNRCYRPALSHEKSREIILGGSGTHFDPEIIEGG